MTPRELLLDLLDRHISDARLRFVANGWSAVVGRRGERETCVDVTIRVNSPRFFSRVLGDGNLGLGEAYIAQEFDVQDGCLEDFLSILLRNRLDEKVKPGPSLALRVTGIRIVNALRRKAWNVRRHYDLGDDLFEAFLDSTMTYSCGYVLDPQDDLEQLQQSKLQRICQKLELTPGRRLLDIGCGYGGLLLHAAKHHGVEGVGVTNSRRHFERGRENVARAGLAGRVQLQLGDFSGVRGQFDRIVSVGMMEHVPPRQYGRFIQVISRSLAPGGRGLLHTIGCSRARNVHDPFIQRYVFPGSGQPRLSEIAGHLERNRLSVLDVENIVRHYAYTVRRWLERFRGARLDTARYDAAFRRLWEYYLCCGIAAALASPSAVYQVLFTNDPAASMPLRRV